MDNVKVHYYVIFFKVYSLYLVLVLMKMYSYSYSWF